MGSWEGVRFIVAGDAGAPNAACLATLREMVERWAETKSAIRAFVRALPGETLVPLEGPYGGFAARHCGFASERRWESVAVLDAVTRSAHVTFYTGEPDGYVTYDVSWVDGQPDSITAYCS